MKTALVVMCLCGLLSAAQARAGDAAIGLDKAPIGFEDVDRAPRPRLDDGADALDEALSGFDGPAQSWPDGRGDPARPTPSGGDADFGHWLELGGELTLLGIVNFAHDAPEPGHSDHRGLSCAQARLRLQADADLAAGCKARLSGYGFHDFAYALNGRDGYKSDQLDAQESEAEISEAWLWRSLSPWLDVKVGRQVVVWGHSDNLRVTDVLNPADYRVPGLTDLEDLRLPVFMTRLDASFGDWTLSGYVIHEPRFSKYAPYGSDFYSGGLTPPPPDDRPDMSWADQQTALSLDGRFSGWDLSFYAASIFNDQGHLENTGNGLTRRHERLAMLGSAFNVAEGNWLFKAELAHFAGLKFHHDPQNSHQRSDVLLGVEHGGFQDVTICLEWAMAWLWNFDESLEPAPDYAQRDAHQWTFRITRSLMHEKLKLTLLASAMGVDLGGGGFARGQFDYDWGNAVHLKGGAIFYQSGDRPAYANIQANDRLFLELEYSF